jgi:hypothetical protein
MSKSPIHTKSKTSEFSITIKREKWAGKRAGYHSVARENGRFVAQKKWHSSADTKTVRENAQILRPKYYAPERVAAAAPPRRFYPVERPVKYDILLRITSKQKVKNYIVIHSRDKHLSDYQMQYHVDRLKIKDEYRFGKIDYIEEIRITNAVSGELIWKK